MPYTKLPRKRPCASCPYRKDVPSGVWDASEYEKLPDYDGDIGQQLANDGLRVFGCHQADGHACAGWAGHRDPLDMVAVRIACASGNLDPAIADYSTDVPLWASGQEAAEHGMRDIEAPSPKAVDTIHKLVSKIPTLVTEGPASPEDPCAIVGM